ncbi:Re/Si-specific NAD(P)(+) transhydrogenase subunit alpha [Streptomyces sp. S.PNR 29]|uniref:Re/Si-specific NAD(P)(+) transhydrogenase subunit alpha n=1 Tax=Streptomyces sp. S.PNR 29 TaxID=2973805 RepID=UPI0025B0D260|nr:Re/Si-specific NAD(P)(+) transhydrogenase subunit alpha [Streptomyces sp. S.PNR 29]MDN0200117.1 Re/Si-specific NAD(P)(+) transhydrogenase subunit alpha [Streptomyces sp. S.PNR 29]
MVAPEREPEAEPQRIGIPAESAAGETRVAATPSTVGRLVALGYHVIVEPGAGESSRFSDAAYEEAGARLGDPWPAEIVLKVNAPSREEIGRLSDGATLIALIGPALHPELVEELARRPITVLAMDAVPRISRAQSLDVLSSMANIAGYRAVIEAAHAFGRFFTGQVTAAGKVPPAKVLVAGAGVAGLAAIGAARSLGAVVRATDPRPEVAEQVRSLGGEFLTVRPDQAEQEVSTDGYAKATSDDYNRLAARLYAEQAADVDIIITTALVPGRPAPKLITAEHVARMKPGSVIVDMAAVQGGNVEGTVAGKAVVTDNDVTIIGYTDLPGRLPAQASQLYGTNLVNLMKLLTPGKDGRLVLDFDDVVQRAMTVVRDGAKTWPPPPVQVSAAPAPAGATEPAAPSEAPAKPARSERSAYALVGAGGLGLFLVTAFSPSELIGHFTVFVLAIVIGFYVIGHVHHALHTPLMSVTNAISGIVVVGALLQIGHGNTAVTVLSFAAILLASINIFGGFAVTRRMLGMFSKG